MNAKDIIETNFRILKSPDPLANFQIPMNHNTAGYRNWWAKKQRMKQQIAATCAKYGSSLNFTVPKDRFNYVKKQNLLFCSNLKVTLFNNYLQRKLSFCSQVGSTTMTAHLYNLTPEAHKNTNAKRPVVIKYFSIKEKNPNIR